MKKYIVLSLLVLGCLIWAYAADTAPIILTGKVLPGQCFPNQIFIENHGSSDGIYWCNAATNTFSGPLSSSGGGTWGSITGTLSSQTDLNTALNGKQASSVFLGKTSSITQTGSDVSIFSAVGVPVLAAGTCYKVEFLLGTTDIASYSIKLYVDGSSVQTFASGLGTGGGADFVKLISTYCNDAGVQNTQTLAIYSFAYTNSTLGSSWAEYPSGLTGSAYAMTPTGVDWSGTHTVAIETNAASGHITGYSFRIGQ